MSDHARALIFPLRSSLVPQDKEALKVGSLRPKESVQACKKLLEATINHIGGRGLWCGLQADLFRAVLAAVFVDSGYTLSAPAGVYVTSMRNTKSINPSLSLVCSPPAVIAAPPEALKSRKTNAQGNLLSVQLTSSEAPNPVVLSPAAQLPALAAAAKLHARSYGVATGADGAGGIGTSEALGEISEISVPHKYRVCAFFYPKL